jgi:hypothetical protein
MGFFEFALHKISANKLTLNWILVDFHSLYTFLSFDLESTWDLETFDRIEFFLNIAPFKRFWIFKKACKFTKSF